LSEVLGKIEKPAIDEFKGKRKLYLVPIVFAGKDLPQEYLDKVAEYWQQAGEQMDSLEKKMGKIKKIYHESISRDSQDNLTILEKINEKGYPLVKGKLDQGAELQVTEDMELFLQNLDWANCLRVVMNRFVFEKVLEYYKDTVVKRFACIAEKINETLQDDETGALFISEGHTVQFPPDIQIFNISPPALDDIHRWLREESEKNKQNFSKKH